MPNFPGQFSGYMTNNLFSSLHTYSQQTLSYCPCATQIIAAATKQGQRLLHSALPEMWRLFKGGH